MADRRVEGVRKDESGEISAICGAWGRVSVEDAAREIESGEHSYYVEEGGVRTTVAVVSEDESERLQATEDPGADNHLDNLPGC